MNHLGKVLAAASLLLSSCQAATYSREFGIADGRVFDVSGGSRIPRDVLQRAGVELASRDTLLNNGVEIATDKGLPPGTAVRLQVIRSTPVLINGAPTFTTARTVGEAVNRAGYDLHVADLIDPPADSALQPGQVISYIPGAALTVSADGAARLIRTSASGTGSALAEAGAPIQGSDRVVPAEQNSPADGGEARVTRVDEGTLVEAATVSFESQVADSAELESGFEQVVHPGRPGLAIVMTRITRHDGVEIGRQAGTQQLVIEPVDRVVLRGTKLVERTETVDGISITYWRNIQMYATVYSPCNSGTTDGSCSSGTASGRPAGKGVVAVDPALYASLNGQRLYIPGYGFAVIGDVGGGFIVEQNLGISRYKWIDLGFDDNNIQDMTGWIAVYFLAPAPPALPEVLR